MSLIEEKSRILIKKGDYYHLTTIKPGKTAMINKTAVKLDALVSHPFGTYFEVVNKSVQKIDAPSFEDEDLLNYEGGSESNPNMEVDCDSNTESGFEQNTNQNNPHVTKEEIMSMKADGVNADDMIKTIVSKNTAFKDRTDYSKTKYIKKKIKRHKLIFQVLKPNSRLIARAVYNLDSKKLLNLSPYDIANVIYKCGLFPNCKVIICEGTGGLITSIILEKLQENVTIVEFFTAEHPKRDGSTFFSFDSSLFANVYPLPVKYANECTLLERSVSPGDLSTGKAKPSKISENLSDASANAISEEPSIQREEPNMKRPKLSSEDLSFENSLNESLESLNGSVVENAKSSDVELISTVDENDMTEVRTKTETEDEQILKRFDEKGSKTNHSQKADSNGRSFVIGPKHEKGHKMYIDGNFDCLLLISKFDPLAILKHCYPKLAPSRPIVIFHTCIDVIRNCADWLKDEKRSVNIEVCDVFSREYQVLPNRTRPTMKPEETTGYCLSAIKVQPNDSV
ncbi:tRNA (adenine(58)-N(1))-methyltransferase non-catalytic subunit TRM6-like [Convolutriloba macropyga]|uniref:tRNA (adenine(58)-N(1))-methyltransferase non-catalytic subunit TRM6-like n=1 Tax=Convolutriloba macropyga TaxID=536237 RepID=UPI003F526031